MKYKLKNFACDLKCGIMLGAFIIAWKMVTDKIIEDHYGKD